MTHEQNKKRLGPVALKETRTTQITIQNQSYAVRDTLENQLDTVNALRESGIVLEVNWGFSDYMGHASNCEQLKSSLS